MVVFLTQLVDPVARSFSKILAYLDSLTEISISDARSSILPAFYIIGTICVLTAVFLLADGGPNNGFDTGNQTSSTPTPSLTEKATKTSIAAPTPTKKPAEHTEDTAEIKGTQEELSMFEAEYRYHLRQTYRDEALQVVPVLGTEYIVNSDGNTTLWVVYRKCDSIIESVDQEVNIANLYSSAVAYHSLSKPDRLRAYAVSDLKDVNDTTWYIQTDEAWNRYFDISNSSEYFDILTNRLQWPSPSQNVTAYKIAVNESGRVPANDAFYDDHSEPRTGWCVDDSKTPPPLSP